MTESEMSEMIIDFFGVLTDDVLTPIIVVILIMSAAIAAIRIMGVMNNNETATSSVQTKNVCAYCGSPQNHYKEYYVCKNCCGVNEK